MGYSTVGIATNVVERGLFVMFCLVDSLFVVRGGCTWGMGADLYVVPGISSPSTASRGVKLTRALDSNFAVAFHTYH